MADYSVDVNVPNPVTTNVNLSTDDGSPLEIESAVELSTKDNLPIKTDSTLHVPEPVVTDSTLHVPEPIVTDSTFRIPDPIKTESTAEIDLKPVALDQCLRIKLDPLPATCIRQPYRQHIGFSFFGMEFFSVDFKGETNAYIEGHTPGPQVLGTSVGNKSHVHRKQSVHGQGLRIQLKD